MEVLSTARLKTRRSYNAHDFVVPKSLLRRLDAVDVFLIHPLGDELLVLVPGLADETDDPVHLVHYVAELSKTTNQNRVGSGMHIYVNLLTTIIQFQFVNCMYNFLPANITWRFVHCITDLLTTTNQNGRVLM